MLCKLSFSNIKKSFKDYAIYFITLILGVCIFYVFNSLDSQTAMLKVNSTQSDMIDILKQLLSFVSVFVSFILGFLIIYASRFLIKKRNKEFGIYMALGMSKRKISILLLMETFIIGLMSLVLGLLLGVFVSQITSVAVANMFKVDMSHFAFNFSLQATIKTMIYFGIIYFIVMIFNTVNINKNKLIDLLQASKKQEQLKLKNPIVCILLFIVSIVLLGSAYYMVTVKITTLFANNIQILLVPVILGSVGTVLFFYSVAGMMLKVLSSRHNLYSKNLNTFIIKQINSKVNTMVVSVSFICIMLFFTLCLLSTAFTMKNYFNVDIDKYAPVDLEIRNYYVDKYDEDFFNNYIQSNSLLKENIKDITIINIYYDKEFTYGVSLGNQESKVRKQYPFLSYNNPVSIVGENEYNKIAKLYGFDSVELEDDEYTIVCNYMDDYYKNMMKNNNKMKIFGYDLKPSDSGVVDGFIDISGSPTNNGFFVVKDYLINKNSKQNQTILANYKTNDEKTIQLVEEEWGKFGDNYDLLELTKLSLEANSVGLRVIVTFVGLYLGIIFLISASAILALKELSDCIDDKNKYKILRQIGANEKDINKALFYQSLIFFTVPLSLALVHTIFGLKFCTIILNSMGINNLWGGLIGTILFLVGIYGIYFVITYLCTKSIVKDRA